jgi:hypothetical protein
LYSEGCSLAEALSVKPVWLTSTVKAKVIAGIVLGLRFLHSLGLIHGGLTTSNIVFDLDHCIQLVDFQPFLLTFRGSESEGEGWTPEVDIQAFGSILFEIVVGEPAEFGISIPADIPDFISTIIISTCGFETRYSFGDIIRILRENEFRMEDGVDSAEVSAFVSWVESAEQLQK